MQRIQQQIDQLRQQLAGLSASQKMLVATLLAVMVVTVVWWVRYAATHERVVLLDQPLTVDQIGPIQNLLTLRNIDHRVQGDRILVPASQRNAALGALSYERLLPSDTTSHFDKAIDRIGSFDPRQKTDLVKLSAIQNDLEATLRHMPGVRHAKVHINATYRRQIGQEVLPSATVNLQTGGSVDQRRLADASAHAVSGAVSMLAPSRVTIIIDGQRLSVDDDSRLASGSRQLELLANAERHFEDAVRRALGYIPGLHLSVSVEINDTVSRRTSTTIDPDNKLILPLSENHDTEESGGGRGGQEPGVGSNIGMAAASVGGDRQQSRSRETSETQNIVDYDRTREETFRDARGGPTPVSCSLSVPMSWLLAEFKHRFGQESESDPALLEQFKQQRLADLRRSVSNALANVPPERIEVGTYVDSEWIAVGGPGGDSIMRAGLVGLGSIDEEGGGISNLIRDYGREAAVAALALVTLFLVSSMVKKSAPLPLPPAPTLDGEVVTLSSGDDLAGEAIEAEAALMGQEVNDEHVRSEQVLGQVQTLVRENPEAAAALVKRWLSAV